MASKFSAVLGKTGLGRMTTGEYQANLNGLNMFFGAVLGFVMTGTETLDTLRFGLILTMLAGAVISILYISSSKNRLAYALYALVVAFTFPDAVDFMLRTEGIVPAKIRPTLLVWTAMTILVEFWGREQPPASPD